MKILTIDDTPFTIFAENIAQEVKPDTLMLSLCYNGRVIPEALLHENGIYLPCEVSKIPEDFEFSCMIAMGQ